jgi:xanthine dehydrogenase YagS FAD-binding subunit
MNREHALFETSRCVAASASDTAPALVALNATMVIKSTQGERMLSAEDYFVGPSIDIQNTTALRPGEVLTAVRLPTDWANASFYYEKVSDRNVWDFSLVNVAAAFKLDNEIIQDSRIVCGAVQCTPRRIVNVENAIRGQVKSQKTADLVSDSATAGAKALAHNGFKVPLMRNLVKRAIAA